MQRFDIFLRGVLPLSARGSALPATKADFPAWFSPLLAVRLPLLARGSPLLAELPIFHAVKDRLFNSPK
jgi:hypothetical protein